MFRIWGKIFKENRLIADMVVELDDQTKTRTQKIYESLERICYTYDLEKPLWLTQNKNDFLKHAKCRFNQDSFIENIDFDFLEIQVIEEE